MATLRQIVSASVALQQEADKLDKLRLNRQDLQARAASVAAQLAIAQQDVANQRAVLDAAKLNLQTLLGEEET